MSVALGSKIGPYEVLSLIGQGGMGEVYRAHDTRLRRDVAIKTSLQRFDERFEREARAIAALNHPNICQIYDVGPDYLVMELVEGPTLAERIQQGPVPLAEALPIFDQIAEALAAAHEKHITHRDLKPANIKIREDGVVKVLDFGLAKIGGAPTAASDNSPTVSLTLTQVGGILGTAAYMSPEQARGKPVDSRADIWAFGVVMYEVLTGRRLFQGEDLTEVLASIVKETPDVSGLPHTVRRLVEACLEKDPRKRLQAIGDRRLLLSEPNARRNWLWPAIATAVTMAAAALSWIHFRETVPAVQSLRYQLTRTSDSGFGNFQLSPDGRHLVFTARSGAAGFRLYVRALDSLEEREFPGTDGVTYPFWSPDSAHIAFFAQGKLKQVAVGGGPVTNIADAPDGRGGAWGKDDTIVFAPAVTGTLFRVSANGGGRATPMDLPRPGGATRDSLRFPAFLPDSDRFFYTIEADKREGEGIYIGSLSGVAPARLLPDLSITQFVPSPGSATKGHILFRRNTTLMAQPFNAAKLNITGEAFPLADDVPNSGNNANVAFTVSTNGTLIYLAGDGILQEHELAWLDRNGKPGKPILQLKSLTDFALSPNKEQLAYSLSDQVVPGDLWLLDVARGAPRKFTFGPFNAYSPVWSPDSSTIAFTAFPEDRLYTKATQTSAQAVALPVSGTNSYASSWSSDGKLLVFSQTGASTRNDIWLLPMDQDRKPRIFKQTPFDEMDGQLSPDGRSMAYTSDASGQYEIYVEPVSGGGAQHQISVGGGVRPVWRRDGRELYFVSDRRLMAVDVKPGQEPGFGAPHELFRNVNFSPNLRTFIYQPSADGSQFLVRLRVSEAPESPPLTVVTNWQHAFGK